MNISNVPFGILPDGRTVTVWTLRADSGCQVEILDYGVTIRSLLVPDRNGKAVDVVLGYDTLEEYISNPGYFGAVIGRFANRIAGASYEWNDTTYSLSVNNLGKHHVHGGHRGFDKQVWDTQIDGDTLIFHYFSRDGEEGYPGNLDVFVRIRWQGSNLCLCYEAISDQDTILNLTNHSYFDLSGVGSVENHLLSIQADAFCEVDREMLPTGKLLDITGTALDFRTEKPLGRDIDHIGRYNHNLVLSGHPAATAYSPVSGIRMILDTDQPGIQLYTADEMPLRPGKGGRLYGHRAAFCLEPQHYPDCIHFPQWPSCVLRQGERWQSTTTYSFDAMEDL